MWRLDHKEGWASKNWCFWIVALEKTLESPLDCKVIKSVSPKGNQPWIFIGRTDADTPIFWLPDAKSQFIRKDRCWERLRTRGEEGNRGWDGWRASLTQWTWVWAHSGRQGRIGRPGVLQSMGLQSRMWLHSWTITTRRWWCTWKCVRRLVFNEQWMKCIQVRRRVSRFLRALGDTGEQVSKS